MVKQALFDTDRHVRVSAASALGDLGGDGNGDLLLAQLARENDARGLPSLVGILRRSFPNDPQVAEALQEAEARPLK